MKKKGFLFIILLLCTIVDINIYAQETYAGAFLTWYNTKERAFEEAEKQNKMILLVYGLTTCYNTNMVKTNLASSDLRAIIDDNYVLWWCDAAKYNKTNEEVAIYVRNITITYPIVCVIKPSNPYVFWSRTNGSLSKLQLSQTLSKYVANYAIMENKDVILHGKQLIINTPNTEYISIHTINGVLIDFFKTNETITYRNISTNYKGLIIISSNLGWSSKRLMQ